MSYICASCGKNTVTGRSQQHKRGVAGKRWKKRAQKTSRIFKPNLQKVAVMAGGVKQTMKLCAKCIKRFEKEGKLFDYKKVALG